ncbi:MAG TPA: phage holin family protein [Candidatus Limnocylindrales bacterium]
MKGFILGILASAIAFVILVNVLPASMIAVAGAPLQLVLLALAVGVVNAVIKPIVKLLSFPISLMTLGLAGIVINAGLLLGVAFLADKWAKIDFTIGGWPAGGFTADTIVGAVVASVLLGVISAVVGLVVKD